MEFGQFSTGVIPYLPYSKQSKMRNRGAIPAKLIATMLCRAGINYILRCSLCHSKAISNYLFLES